MSSYGVIRRLRLPPADARPGDCPSLVIDFRRAEPGLLLLLFPVLAACAAMAVGLASLAVWRAPWFCGTNVATRATPV
jgi:hypothetical protein